MNNFHYRIPTEIYFGKNQIENLKNITAFGKTVLLVYGGQSIKKMGLYNKVKSILEDCRMNVFELGGVEPNPKIESVRKGVDICKKEKVDVVLPVGGGSVLDCAKVIAAGAKYDGDPWDLVLDGSKIAGALPVAFIGTVLVMSLIFDKAPLYQLMSGGLIIGAFFMATDYATTPSTKWGKVIFGIGCGLITILIRFWGTSPEGVSYSILLMNIFTPYISRLTRPRPLTGGVR